MHTHSSPGDDPKAATPAGAAGGWTIEEHGIVDTTQALARAKPAWHAVVAAEQGCGRGQRERTFVSDRGGLYLTAVVPFDGDAAGWRGFALAVGGALRDVLVELGVDDLRLRWPNDLMIGPRKAGGILVEQGGPRTLLIGVGINITNQPWLQDHALRASATRLLDHCSRVLTGPGQLLDPVLRAIGRAHDEFSTKRLGGIVPGLNRCWGPRRHVWLEAAPEIDLPETEGAFAGIDENGRVLIARPDGSLAAVPEHHIQRLVEIA